MTMRYFHVSVALALTWISSAGLSQITMAAAADSSRDLVLRQEARWLTAIVNGDSKTLDSILTKDFKHITSKGELLDRAQELANTAKQTFTMNPTEQTVDFAGDTAVVRGVNTITRSGKVLARQRFTDVFVKQNDTWMAMSAQETAMQTAKQTSKTGAKDATSVSGVYQYKHLNVYNTLQVQELSGGKIKFQLTALLTGTDSPRNGEISGTAILKNGTATYSEDGCTATLSFSKGEVRVSVPDGDACGFGAYVTADGAYKRISSKIPKLDF